MPASRKTRWQQDFPETFLPEVAEAADAAVEEVLAEDFALRQLAAELDFGRPHWHQAAA